MSYCSKKSTSGEGRFGLSADISNASTINSNEFGTAMVLFVTKGIVTTSSKTLQRVALDPMASTQYSVPLFPL